MKFGNYDPQSFMSASKETLITTLASYRIKNAAIMDRGEVRDYANAMEYAINHYDELKPGYVPTGIASNNRQNELEAKQARNKKIMLAVGLSVLVIGAMYFASRPKKRRKR